MQKKRILSMFTALVLCLSMLPAVSGPALADGETAVPVPIFQDTSYSFAERAADLVARMSLPQKAGQLLNSAPAITAAQLNANGGVGAEVPATKGVTAYGWNAEAAHGLTGANMSYPVNYSIGSSWDKDLYFLEAEQIGKEIREVRLTTGDSRNMAVFSPTMNISRDPRWGRNDESYSEDAYHTGVMGAQYVNGMEGKDRNGRIPEEFGGYNAMLTTIKHYTANDSEQNRLTGGAYMDLRTLREYYTAPYRDIIKLADVSSVMTAYSHVNGIPVSMDSYLMDTLLRQMWGFSGYIVSDCDSVSTIARHRYVNPHTGRVLTVPEIFASALAHGEDLECGTFGHGSQSIGSYATNYNSMLGVKTDMGVFTENQYDISAYRMMLARMKVGNFDGEIKRVTDARERAASYSGSTPRQTPERLKIAEQMGEGGIVLLQNNKAGGEALLPLKIPATGSIKIALIGYWATSNFLGGYSGSPGAANLVNIQTGITNAVKAINPDAEIVYNKGFTDSGTNVNIMWNIDPTAIELAASADIAIVVAGTDGATAKEDGDRSTIRLPGAQAELISRVGKANPKTVAVMETCGPVEVTTFEDDVPAIVWSSFAGMRKGVAFANVLLGKTNPSGKTAGTWYTKVNDTGETDIRDIIDYSLYNDETGPGRTYMYYTGPVSYPFGFGLSYTSFEYSNLKILKGGEAAAAFTADDTITVSFDIKNTGPADGKEVAQLYAAQPNAPAALKRPIKRLKAFDKVSIPAGETKTVTLDVKAADLAFYDEAAGKYVVDQGAYEIQIGKSSADVALRGTINVSGAITPVPSIVTAKPNQDGDVEKGIGERLIYGKDRVVNPNVAVAMNDESIFGTIVVDNIFPITSPPHIGTVPLPAGAAVVYSSNRPGVVKVEDDGTIRTIASGVATITATVTYNGVSASGEFVVYVVSEPYLDGITVGGEPLESFKKDRLSYSVAVPSGTAQAPTVGFVGNQNKDFTVSVAQASTVPGVAVIEVKKASTGEAVTTYRVGFAPAPVTTDFKKGAPLGAEWSVLNPVPANASFVEGGLKISTTKGSFGTEALPENVYLQYAAGDWASKAHLSLSETPSVNNQKAGLVLYEDDSNYVTFVYERGTGAPNAFRAYRVTAGGAPALLGAVISADQTDVFLQIVKSDDKYSFLYSLNGNSWTSAATAEIQYTMPRLGLFANNGAFDAPPISAVYEYLNVYGDISLASPRLSMITIDGKDIDTFAPDMFDYSTFFAEGQPIPVVGCVYDEALFKVSVTQAKTLPGVATIRIWSEFGDAEYSVTFGESPTSSTFVRGEIDNKWSIDLTPGTLNGTGNDRYSVAKGRGLNLPTQPNDIAWVRPNPAGKPIYNVFTRPAAGDWDAIVKVFMPVTFGPGGYPQAIFMAWQDEDNYVKVESETVTLFTHTGIEKNGVWTSTDSTNPALPGSDGTYTIYYRIKKSGNIYRTAFSNDGINYHWFNVDNPLEINLKNPKLALFSTRNGGGTLYDVYYEYLYLLEINGVVEHTPADMMQWAFDNVAGYVFDDVPASAASDIVFSTVPHGYSVSAVSSDESVITNEGKVIRGAAAKSADLTVTVTDGVRSESKIISVTVPKASVESVSAVKTLVEGRAANVVISVAGPNLSGLKASLFGKTADIAGGTAALSFTAAQIPAAGSYSVDILDGDYIVAKAAISVVAEPAGLWKPAVAISAGQTKITFGADISFNAAKKSVTVGGDPVADNLLTAAGKVLTIAADATGKQIVVSGLKYADLFPSYSFTFTI